MKTKRPVNRGDLLQVIKQLESRQEFPAISHLALAVSQTEWAVSNKITSSIVGLRINEFNLLPEISTKPGKRGRQGGPISDEQKAAMKAGRVKKQVDPKWIKELKKNTPSTYLPIIDKIESGSLKASTKLYCLQCTNFNKSEIKNCTILSCALYQNRPYK